MSEVCHHCGQRIKIGQSQLTPHEKRKFDWGGPNDNVNIIKAQCVKAAAEYYGIMDWTAFWDTSLSVGENIDNMAKLGDTPTMRDLKAQAMRE